jgi:disulfide bond formation protein DsbB
MSTASWSHFFAFLTAAAWAATLAVWILAVAHRRDPDSLLGALYEDVGRIALWFAALVAFVAMAGSLYYSDGAHFVPCKLCWYQRIAMYPLGITLLVGAIRRDGRVGWYVVPQALIGAAIAIYHTQLQAYPNQHSSFCTVTEPCTVRFVWEFGFISLPMMALSAFVLIITLTLVARPAGRAPAVSPEREPGDERELVTDRT